MSASAIKIALEQGLKAGIALWSDANRFVRIGYENTFFTPPTDGSEYLTTALLLAAPENPTMGDAFYREVGVFQVNVSYPINGGAGKAYARATQVRDIFKRGNSFQAGGITVIAARTPQIVSGLAQGDRYVIPVRVPFFANVMP